MDMTALKKQLHRRHSQLKSERMSQGWDAHYKEIAQHFHPRKPKFLDESPQQNAGAKKHNKILDERGILARRTLSAGLMTGVTNSSKRWIKFTTHDPDLAEFAPVKEWLEQLEKRIHSVLARSNYYQATQGNYDELGCFGVGPVAMVADFDTVVRSYPMTVGEYFLAQNDRLEVDTCYREYTQSVSQIFDFVKRKGGKIEDISRTVRSLYDRGCYGEQVPIIHAVEPNRERDHTRIDKRNMAYRSVYLERDCGSVDGGILSFGGHKRFPISAPRWDVYGNDVYGSSCPGMDALGAIKQLQNQQAQKAEGIEMMVRPPVQIPSTFKNSIVDLVPGGATYYDAVAGGNKIEAVYDGRVPIQYLTADIEAVADRVKQCFYADLFLMLAQSDRREITAREVDEVHDEKLNQLGPVYGRLNSEKLDKDVDLAFYYTLEAGLLAPPPKELENQNLEVEYVSLLGQAMRMSGVTGIRGIIQAASEISSASGDPTVWDKINKDQTIDELATMYGPPAKVINSDDVVSEIRTQRAQQLKQQQTMENVGPMAKAASDLAKAPTGKNSNALTDILKRAGVQK